MSFLYVLLQNFIIESDRRPHTFLLVQTLKGSNYLEYLESWGKSEYLITTNKKSHTTSLSSRKKFSHYWNSELRFLLKFDERQFPWCVAGEKFWNGSPSFAKNRPADIHKLLQNGKHAITFLALFIKSLGCSTCIVPLPLRLPATRLAAYPRGLPFL